MALPGQSLADAARKEAERRKELAQQGVLEKVIDAQDIAQLGAKGNLSILAPARDIRPVRKVAPLREQASVAPYRNALQKLDREIRQLEDRLALLRKQAAAERWSLRATGRSNRNTRNGSSGDRLLWQIQEAETKHKRLKQDRIDAYNKGRKAGFLPGELDGKGIIP